MEELEPCQTDHSSFTLPLIGDRIDSPSTDNARCTLRPARRHPRCRRRRQQPPRRPRRRRGTGRRCPATSCSTSSSGWGPARSCAAARSARARQRCGRRARAVAPGRHGHRQAVVARLARDGAWRHGPRRRPVRRLHRTGRRRLAALSTREVSTALLIIASFWHVLVGAKVHAVDT